VGGATGRIGDPSGRATERALLDEATLERNVRGIESCLRQLDTEGGPAFEIVNNFDWYRGMNVLSFLRDVGKHFRLGTMLAKVRSCSPRHTRHTRHLPHLFSHTKRRAPLSRMCTSVHT
jgi:tyrosyl-tRNA synthetase